MCRFTKHFALLIAMLLASIQYGLSATSYDYEEKIDGVTAYFTFNSEDRTLNLVGVSANLVGNFDVPSKASNGLKITSIGEQAFRDCTGLTSVVIPNSVTSIGGVAFYGCKSLMSVKLYGENPPECPSDANAFGQQNVMFVLYVPVGTKDKYRSHYAYKIYYIEEFDPEEDPFDSNNDVKTIVADEYDGVIDVYNMYGVKVLSTYKKDEIDNLQKGIYVVKVGQKTDKYIVK